MARFVKHVRMGGVAWPTQRKYKQKAWSAAFEREHDGSLEDRALHESGLIVYDHLQQIRDAATSLPLPLPKRTASRLFCAMLNRSLWWIKNQLDSRVRESLESTEVVNLNAITEQLFSDCYGNDASVEASIEIAVDGVTVPLRLAMNGWLGNGQAPDDLEVIQRLIGHMRLGQTYTEIEALWQQCLWEGYHVERTENVDIYIPPEQRWVIASAVGQYRHEQLRMQDAGTAVSVLNGLPPIAWKRLKRKKVLKAVGKRSPLRVTTTSPKGRGADSLPQDRTLVGRIISLSLYLEPLLQEPLPGLERLSVDNVLEVWGALQFLAERLHAQFQHADSIVTVEEMLAFAPTISRPSLEAAVARATKLSPALARRAVRLLTFTGSHDDTLWLQPLVRTSPDELTVVTPPLLSIHVLWLIEQLLAKGQADLEARGPEFEASVRERISEYAKDGRLDAVVYPIDIEFGGDPVEPGQPDKEQIDLLLRVGSVVVVGEVKCQLFPNTSALRRYNYRRTLEGAAEQAARKAAFAEKNRDQLLEHVGWADCIDPAPLSFHPLVITNVSLGVGFEVGGVPVADSRVVGQFLKQGTVVRNAVIGADNDVLSADVEPLYDSPADAPGKLIDYLRSPPQIRLLEEAVTVDKRLLGVPPASDDPERLAFSIHAKVRTFEDNSLGSTEANSSQGQSD